MYLYMGRLANSGRFAILTKLVSLLASTIHEVCILYISRGRYSSTCYSLFPPIQYVPAT